MRYAKVSVTCRGCGSEFKVSPSRQSSASFCSAECYHSNQHRRRGAAATSVSPQSMVGQTYGRLTVQHVKSGRYVCICQCGNQTSSSKKDLVTGRVQSCGCYNREKGRKPGADTARVMWFRYVRDAAKQRSLHFDLTFDEVMSLCSRPCSYCGSPPRPWEGAKRAYLTSARRAQTREPDLVFAESKVIDLNGIDRIDSSAGYTLSNVTTCCSTCNSAKMNLSIHEFKSWVRRAYRHMFSEEA